MEKDLENLVKKAESAIDGPHGKSQKRPRNTIQFPKASIASLIWLVAIFVAIFQFDAVLSIVRGPTEDRIEKDLSHVLENAAESLHIYEAKNGGYPPILPNAAIRGLVKYERQTAYQFRLSATIGDVTVVFDSLDLRPHRDSP